MLTNINLNECIVLYIAYNAMHCQNIFGQEMHLYCKIRDMKSEKHFEELYGNLNMCIKIKIVGKF